MRWHKLWSATRVVLAQVSLCGLLVCCNGQASAQDTVRIATYNLLNYPGSDATTRNPRFRAVTRTMNPDVLVVQEMTSAAGTIQFRDSVLNAGQPGTYSSVAFNNGPDTDNMFYYRTSKVGYIGATYISTALRNIAEYRFKPVASPDTIRIFSVHLKANLEDSLARLAEATILRNYLNALPTGAKFIVAGDFNIYRSSEPAFQRLIGSEVNNNGRSKDPLNAIGTWNQYAFRAIHTQSTRTRAFGDGSTGGLDDRFDMQLISYSMEQHLLLSTYAAYGNDGNHFNDSINRLPNAAVADSVANGLHYASDHLPVVANYVFGSPAPDTGYVSIASGNWTTPGIWSGGNVPTATSYARVAGGTTVTINGNVACKTLNVEGILQFDATDGRTLTVGGNVGIETGGEVRPSASFVSGATTQSLNMAGNFTNNGTFTPLVTVSSVNRAIHVTFDGNTPVVIDGTTNPTTFRLLRMNLSSTLLTLTPLIDIGFIGNTANALTLTRGTWVQSSSQTTTPGVNITVDANAVLSLSDAGAFTAGASLLVGGILDVSGGFLYVGGGNNRLEVLAGGLAEFVDGTTTINGRLTLSSGTTVIEGGGIVINPRGSSNLGGTSNVFEAAAAATVTMTGGSLTVVNPKTITTSGREIKLVIGAGTKNFTGGTIYLGVGAGTLAGSDTGFVVESGVTLPRLVVRTGGGTGKDVALASSLSVRGLELESGTLKLASPYSPGSDVTVLGDLLRTGGTLAPGTRTVTMGPAGAPTTIGAGFTGANELSTLVINNVAGVDLASDLGVSSALTILSGNLNTGPNTIILGSSADLTEPAENAVQGYITTTRNVPQSVNNTFGNIGFELNAVGATPGLTTVVRRTGTALTSGFASSIKRWFDVLPATNTGLDATVRFFYDTGELNGQTSSTLRLWKSPDTGATWSEIGGVVNVGLRRIEASGIDDMSLWTASDSANPLNQIALQVPVTAGWNLVSNPVRTPLDSVRQVFPPSVFPFAYAFTSSGYEPRYTMTMGRGFWQKFNLNTSANISGQPVAQESVHVTAGWNLIGSVSYPVDTAAIVQVPPGIKTSDFIGFNGTYGIVDTLYPGRAYWVKVNASGSLVLSGSVPRPVLRSDGPSNPETGVRRR